MWESTGTAAIGPRCNTAGREKCPCDFPERSRAARTGYHPGAMKLAILDDWFDTLRGLPCFARLAGHDVAVWTDHTDDEDLLADRLRDTEGLVLIRERTAIRSSLLERLPKL